MSFAPRRGFARTRPSTATSERRLLGRVMAALKERYAGRMDLGKASGMVKGLLG
jgi:uncharacterized protein YqeY